jgi:glyoxalase family protein
MATSAGLHHITAIASDARRNAQFYTDVLGLRLVKKTVNFDDPGTYHLYFGDEQGSPGTILTFFPWAGVGPGQAGPGQAVEIGFLVPPSSAGYWTHRLVEKGVPHEALETRLGDRILPFRDPDGMRLSLVFSPDAADFPGWSEGGVPAEHAIRGFWNVTLWVDDLAATAKVLTEGFGWRKAEAVDEQSIVRYTAPGEALGTHVDLREVRGFPSGGMGAGSIHHVAFRATDDAQQAALSQHLQKELRLAVTGQKDRNYFRSVYFREPSGVLFEIATDPPGFTADEPLGTLGEALKLPPWLEAHRAEIEKRLPPLA